MFKTLHISPLKAHLVMVIWTLLVASSFPASAKFSPQLSSTLLVSLRFVVAGVIMYAFIRQVHRPTGNYPFAPFVYLLLGLLLAGFFSLMFTSLHYTTPLTLAALSLTQPLMAYIQACFLRLERPTLRRSAELLVAAGAALIIVSHGEPHQLLEMHWGRGQSLFLIACFLGAGYLTLTRWFTDHHLILPHAYTTTCYSLLAGGVAIALPQIVLGHLPEFISLLTWHDIGWLTYLMLFTTLLTFWMFQYATLNLSPSLVSAYGYLPPLVVLLVSVVIGITPGQPSYWLATILLIGAITGLALHDRGNK